MYYWISSNTFFVLHFSSFGAENSPPEKKKLIFSSGALVFVWVSGSTGREGALRIGSLDGDGTACRMLLQNGMFFSSSRLPSSSLSHFPTHVQPAITGAGPLLPFLTTTPPHA
jgi:hypothetical protein